jgi:streptomycin 6-kinase
MFFNPHPRLAVETDIPGLVARRHALICDVTGLDRYRVAAWGFARAMLSVCWSASSGSPVARPTVAVAKALRGLM